ncbi:hypothetical protein JW859_08150 [bacterium]|nr:hypothetical protein [bacterium]
MSMIGEGKPASRAPAVEKTLASRIVSLRHRAENGATQVAWASMIPGFGISVYCAHMFGAFALIGVLGAAGSSPVAGITVYMVMLILIAGLLSSGVWHLVRWGARKLLIRYHAQTWYELHETNFMALVVDEVYTGLLIDHANSVWSLRWISPPKPKTVEQLLEFGACYQVALRRMLRGVGRLESGPLWQGGMAWYAGVGRGAACGCLALLLLSWLGIGLIVIGFIFYLQRCGALIAYCDFLLYDERLRELLQQERAAAAPAVTPPPPAAPAVQPNVGERDVAQILRDAAAASRAEPPPEADRGDDGTAGAG